MSTLSEVAKQLLEIKENVILVYAFNATGKTRLSVEYKNLTKDPAEGKHSGVYYNAYSEDLFIWDNDIENGEQTIKLDIKYSSLNALHGSFTEDEIYKKLVPYSLNTTSFLFQTRTHKMVMILFNFMSLRIRIKHQ